ncbi:hypothetical protein CDD82_3051 [Ophiocordyceps australis]|uniref:ER-bound oxygenase mpaB/mpaB'/Rubber oxygenase catalytic domain-containing protein n=1 Tax=Ophiocordyceps australis TaxID=1399860 RepID=A0A2C5ZGV0_9HYPO|nr:hypothetical protein CDD82_3051 [Ophiocordyceps australis]
MTETNSKAGPRAIPVIQHTFSNAVFFSGTPLAAVLQLAHPGVARGVCKHSRFRHDAYSRCHRSIVFLVAVMFGTEEEKDAICSVVRRQHAHVHGAGYDANDAELQRWVAATGLMATVKVHETFFGPMDARAQDALCVEFGVFGRELGMPAQAWFASWREFDAYWTQTVAGLRVSDEGREMARMVLYGLLPWYLGWVAWAVRVFVAAWLPESLARAFGLEAGMWFGVLAGLGRVVCWAVPGGVWRALTLVLVHDMQRAAAAVAGSGRWTM